MPETTPEPVKIEPVTQAKEPTVPNEGISNFDFECAPYIDKKMGKKDSKVIKPKEMAQKDWEKQFEQGYLRA